MDHFVHLKIALVVTSLCTLVSSSRLELRKDILRNYVKGIRPDDNVTNVAIYFIPQRLTEFDERAGKFAMSGYLKVYWEDPRIARNWALSSHQSPDIETMYFSESEVWTPHILHVNSFSRFDTENMYESLVHFSSDGWALMSKRDIFTSKCKVDFLKFPYETQKCSIELEVMGYYMDDIDIFSFSDIYLYNMEADTTWNVNWAETIFHVNYEFMIFDVPTKKKSKAINVTDMSTYNVNNVTDKSSFNASTVTRMSKSIRFEFTLKRASSYFSIIVWMPMFLMLHIQILCFYIPRDSGERAGISMTVILSLAIYLTIITEFIPQSSRSGVPFMIVWVFGSLLCSCVVHVFVVISLKAPKENYESFYLYTFFPRCIQRDIKKSGYSWYLSFIPYTIFSIFWISCTFYVVEW